MFGWDAKAKKFEYQTHKFTHASRRLNILANDILRHITLCESLANLARDLQHTQKQFEDTHRKFRVSKEGRERAVLHRHATDLHKRLNHLPKLFKSRLKLLNKAQDTYKEHLKKFSKSIKA